MAVLKITGRGFSSGQGNGLHGNCIEAIGSLEAKYAHEKPVSDFLRTVRAGRDHAAAVHSLYRSAAKEWGRSEEHTSELQSLMRISYAVFCLKKKTNKYNAL